MFIKLQSSKLLAFRNDHCREEMPKESIALYIVTEVFLIFLILNSKLASGKKRKPHVPQEIKPEVVEEWEPEVEKIAGLPAPSIDFRGHIRGSLGLHLALADTTKNSVCSPISALLPFGKLVLGASGKTEAELLTALGYPREDVKDELKELIELLIQVPGVTLTVVSKIYIGKEMNLKPDFAKASKHIFHSTVEKADFSDPAETVQTINTWFKAHTNGMIPNLLSPSDVPTNPSLILVNAVYFQGNWLRPFRSIGTLPFHSPMGTRKVPMMTAVGSYRYIKCKILNVEILEVPYANEAASLIVVLPMDKDGLPMLLTALKLAPKLLNKALSKMKMEYAQVTLPKFKVKTKLNLKDMFKKMDITRVFRQGRDLDKIVDGQSVHVSSAIQESVLEVTETGTEAAAGTATIFATMGGGKPGVIFNADHPFLFYVLFLKQQLFTGTFNNAF